MGIVSKVLDCLWSTGWVSPSYKVHCFTNEHFLIRNKDTIKLFTKIDHIDIIGPQITSIYFHFSGLFESLFISKYFSRINAGEKLVHSKTLLSARSAALPLAGARFPPAFSCSMWVVGWSMLLYVSASCAAFRVI